MLSVKKNDVVKVISGEDKGKEGKVIKTIPKDNRVIVQGINLIWKHIKRSSDYPHGARIQKEASVNVSNVMLVCPNCNKPCRVGYQKPANSTEKNRVCRRCKQTIANQ
jgi:large subunit ribosomal protein L24